MRDRNGLLAQFLSRCILKGQERFEGHVGRHAIIDIVRPEFESRALERDQDFRVGRGRRGDSTGDGTGRKALGRRVDHGGFRFISHVELGGVIAPIGILHLEIGEGGVEGQFDGVGQPRPHVRQGGPAKRGRHFFAAPQPIYGDEETQEDSPSHRELSR